MKSHYYIKACTGQKWKRMAKTVPFVCLLVLGHGSIGSALEQTTGPTVSKGTSSRVLGVIDLKDEIDGLSGRQLRSRYVTIAPGGQVATHSHAGRPTLEYVLQGQVIEIRNGVEVPHGPGEMVVAPHDITHGWENRGTETVVLIPVDIFKE